MKKLIIFICIGLCFINCNFDDINIFGHDKPKHDDLNKLPDLIIHIDRFVLHKDSAEVFLTVKNIGGNNFSHPLTVVKLTINNNDFQELHVIRDLNSNSPRIFHIRIMIFAQPLKNMFAKVDVSNVIEESNEDNNYSNYVAVVP